MFNYLLILEFLIGKSEVIEIVIGVIVNDDN